MKLSTKHKILNVAATAAIAIAFNAIMILATIALVIEMIRAFLAN